MPGCTPVSGEPECHLQSKTVRSCLLPGFECDHGFASVATDDPGNPSYALQRERFHETATAVGIQAERRDIRTTAEVDAVLDTPE
jgi:hypothetical protein